MAAIFAIDGPGGPVVAGDHLRFNTLSEEVTVKTLYPTAT